MILHCSVSTITPEARRGQQRLIAWWLALPLDIVLHSLSRGADLIARLNGRVPGGLARLFARFLVGKR